MAERMNLPSGSGGLLRYDEEYPSKFMMKPLHVVAYVVIIIVVWVILKIAIK